MEKWFLYDWLIKRGWYEVVPRSVPVKISRNGSGPLVSIVMPVYNGERFVSDTIFSVIKQTFTDWELIVVDDASTDESAHIVQELVATDNRIRLIQLSHNQGAAAARNSAIEASCGRFMAFLDGDDLWLPHKLEWQLAFMQGEGSAFSYSAYARVDEEGRYLSPVGVPKKLGYRQLLRTCYIGCLTAMYDTETFGKRYMPLIRRRQDYALWLDLLRNGETASGLNEVLGVYRVRSGSISSNKASTSLYTWRVYRQFEGLSLVRSAWYFAQQTGRAAVRHRLPALARRLGWLHAVDRPYAPKLPRNA